MEPVTPGARLRRLMNMCHVRGHDDEGAGEWRPLRAADVVDALRADPGVRGKSELTQIVYELASGRDEIPPLLTPALCRVLGVPDSYFDDQSVADGEDVRRLPGLLRDLGVVGALLCRCPPAVDSRLHTWTGLLEVARQHARTDRAVAGPDSY